MRRPTATHRLEYALFRGAGALLRALPEGWALNLGSGIGWTAGSLLRIRRKVVGRNLRIAFPDQSDRWRREVAAASYRHLGREGAALLRLQEMSPDQVLDRCVVHGLDHLQDPLAAGEGVLILSGHFGNWELLALALSAYGLPLDAVAHTQANPLFDRDVGERRSRFGMTIIPRSEGTWKVLRSLQKGRAVLLFADQRVIAAEVHVDFFGVPAPTARGPAVFALRTGVRVILATIRALPGDTARYRIDLAPLNVERSSDAEADVLRLTRRYLAALEGAIGEAPEQYFWVHNRWKGCPAGEELQSLRAVSDLPAGGANISTAAEESPRGTGIGDPN